jgi:hypothetical protein
LEQQSLYQFVVVAGNSPEAADGVGNVQVFQNPLDPSMRPGTGFDYACSYVSNAQVFSIPNPTTYGVRDGLSNTIFFTEHYRYCYSTWFDLFSTQIHTRLPDTKGSWFESAPTFADFGYGKRHIRPKNVVEHDFYPITKGNPPYSTARGDVTFQVAPSIGECDPRQPNAASLRGLQVLMGDGSVRTVAKGVSPRIFWGAVTPNRNELDSLSF